MSHAPAPNAELPQLIDQLLKLDAESRCQISQALWESIVDERPEVLSVPAWQVTELERRHAEYLKNPQSLCTWEEIEARVRALTSRHG